MHSTMDGERDLEPHEVFVDVGILIMEGRIPGQSGRGYGEGPHCVPVAHGGAFVNKHECNTQNFLCKRGENFRKHMLLLWQNNVPMCVEVLLCSDCKYGTQKAQSVEVSAIPEPASILLEQWTVCMISKRAPQAQIPARGLLQAVRSYLHFSQLSAWLSRTNGKAPRNIMYRITVPGEAFGSKFTKPPEEHSFPVATVGRNNTVKVSVKALPRCESIPRVYCKHTEYKAVTVAAEKGVEEKKLGAAAAVCWEEKNMSESDLRRSLVKTKLAETMALTVNDSKDTMLGESLLDPPQSLQKFPKRYQSPSRCGSPSLETPEHLLFGYRDQNWGKENSLQDKADTRQPRRNDPLTGIHVREAAVARRVGRQGAVRRRDLSTSQEGQPIIVDDRMHTPCTQSGKHHCCGMEDLQEEDLTVTPRPVVSSPFRLERERKKDGGCLGARLKDGWSLRDSQTKQCDPKPSKPKESTIIQSGLDLELTPKEMEEILAVLRRRSEPSTRCAKEEGSPVYTCDKSELPNDQQYQYSSKLGRVNVSVLSEVYRTEFTLQENDKSLVDKSDLLLGAILRSSKKCQKSKDVPDVCDGFQSERRTREANQKIKLCLPSLKDVTVEPKVEKSKLFSLPQKSSRQLRQVSRNPSLFPVCDNPVTTRTSLEGTTEISDNASACEEKRVLCKVQEIQVAQELDENRTIKEDNSSQRDSFDPDGVNIENKFAYLGKEDTVSKACTVSENETHSEIQTKDIVTKLEPLDITFSSMGFFPECCKLEDLTKYTAEGYSPRDCSLLKHILSRSEKSFLTDNEEGFVSRLIPSAYEKAKFRRSLDSATSMVFHSKTGLPLTSSPAPMRKGTCFDFDSSLTNVAAIKHALFETSEDDDDDDIKAVTDYRTKILSTSAPASVATSSLLCNFEESVLNGRLEPVSTVEGFTAEIGASGTFHPKHLSLPVTVFFYTLCDNDKVSSPYLCHINLGEKGYSVPKRGTIQVTLFNPLGTVVKMFVVMYDLSDMPANSQTFLRQRTLYMPVDETDQHPDVQKWLRYLIHLRFASSKSGRIYLHTDIRMIIFRKSDLDTGLCHNVEKSYELRSFTKGPTNPKFSPRK